MHLARELTRLHSGEIAASSAGPGLGSEFVVRLPLARPPVPESAPAEEVMAGSGVYLRIVIVDDNADAAESLALLLQSSGHLTRVANDGPAGVDQILTFEPDVALVDIGLPAFDGYEVARRVRASHVRPDMLLVAITGWGQETDKARAKEVGFDHHMTKPVTYAQLESILMQVRRSGSPA